MNNPLKRINNESLKVVVVPHDMKKDYNVTVTDKAIIIRYKGEKHKPPR